MDKRRRNAFCCCYGLKPKDGMAFLNRLIARDKKDLFTLMGLKI